ncbi:LysR family transcriptional regulator [Bordetella genomosp. 1]|uniref:LysR family transcriptional regulator n=1 Tax=Bordetella genomosp. 1 TaxID=1395607 RepID=A0A261RVS2_9BORD|nr:LysR family transcriptional regulator [Bordetella genomosp. 1]MDQ8032236.1 LysR family transcriptional regulator [Bordetella sp.]OZI29179.1 LysR family transcriptional regulator [Bordetella genomosp. 1]OZI65088.1 LysR family transcriptional regulator [Bordetella genomosp. 1]
MELAELDIFLAVAREQSVTRAATALGRAQSNITTRIQQLEAALGCTLFTRDNRRMRLTPAGERLVPYARRLTTLAQETRQVMHDDTPSGALRLGAMEAAAASRLPGPLARFHADWPEVALSLRAGTTGALVRAVLAHELDCAVVAHPGEGPAHALSLDELAHGLQGEWLCTEKLMLVLPAQHARVRSAADLRVGSVAAFAPGCTYRACAEAWLGESAATLRVVEPGSYHAMLACVLAGQALSVMPQSVLDLMPEARHVRTQALRPVHSFFIQRQGFDTAASRKLMAALQTAAH